MGGTPLRGVSAFGRPPSLRGRERGGPGAARAEFAPRAPGRLLCASASRPRGARLLLRAELEAQRPGVLRSPAAARVNSSSLTEVHLSFRFASKLDSAELDPVMIKPHVQTDSQWSVPALTQLSVTECAPEFGDVARRNLWVRVALSSGPGSRMGRPTL